MRRLVAAVVGGPVHAYAPHPAVSRMAHRMWSGLHQGVEASVVLAASGLGARQAHRLFTAWFGTTPKRAVLDQRLALARAQLQAGASVTVAAAAAAAGFADRAGLTRAWRRAYGSPPTAR